jgi:hypothetical protein
MKPRIVCWNVRGLNDREKCKSVGNLLRGWKGDLVCLQETKVAEMTRALVRRLWGGPHVQWCCLDAVGASGGILCIWDTRSLEMIESCVGSFSGVYGPNDACSRKILWDELVGLHTWWSLPWCIGGTLM